MQGRARLNASWQDRTRILVLSSAKYTAMSMSNDGVQAYKHSRLISWRAAANQKLERRGA